jgi:hypothetical protein
MARNMFKKYTESKTREWTVPSGTLAGQVVVHATSGQVGVTLTARGDATQQVTLPTGQTITENVGGAGNRPDGATVAVDGSWLIPVTGASASTTPGTAVYRTSGGAINLTASGNTKIGIIDDGVIVGNVAPVLIGAVLPAAGA